MAEGEVEPSAQEGHVAVCVPAATWNPYEWHHRPRRDVWAAVLFGLLMAVAFGFSIAAFTHTDRDAMRHGLLFYRNSTSCRYATYKASPKPFKHDIPTLGTMFAISILTWVPISLGTGTGAAAAFLHFLRRYPGPMVAIATVASLLLGMTAGIGILVSGISMALGIVVLVFSLLAAVCIYIWREDFVLCGELLGVASKGLKACHGIVRHTVTILFIGLLLLLYLLASLIDGWFIGHIAPHPDRVAANVTEGDVGSCYDADGESVSCCKFITEDWARAHCVITALALAWALSTLIQLELYIVSDAMGQWYFSEGRHVQDPSLPLPDGPSEHPVSVRDAVRHGLTCSFGSVCVAGAVLMMLQTMNQVMSWAQQASSQGPLRYVCCAITCCAQFFLAAVQQFTLFSVVAVALFGETFWAASSKIGGTLRRNLLTVFNFWGLPNFVLLVIVGLATVAWACLVVGVVFLRWSAMDDYTAKEALYIALGVGGVSAVTFGFILLYITNMMVDSVNAVFVFYLMDLDRKALTKPEVHSVCEKTPLLRAASAAVRAGAAGGGDGALDSMPLLPVPATASRSDSGHVALVSMENRL